MDANKLKIKVNEKTLKNLGESVIRNIELTANGKVKVSYYNGNVKWFINFFQCFHALNYQYNLKLAPAKTSFAKLADEHSSPRESNRLSTLKVRLMNEIEIIMDRYKLEKLKYFKNTIYKEIKEVIFDDNDVLKLSKKEFNYLKSYLHSQLHKKYGRSGHVNDILMRFRSLQYEELYD